jgi:hypothetical protein
LNPNLTLRAVGGQREEKVTTYVIDEASMLDLELTAAEYRRKWEIKRVWYEKHFPNRLLTTEETGNLSVEAKKNIDRISADRPSL